jgi:predicted ester cyclase
MTGPAAIGSGGRRAGERPRPEALALAFLDRVWGAAHDLDAIDALMSEDYRITSGGTVIAGRAAFKTWVREFQTHLLDARTENVEVFANAAGDRVVSRWVCSGVNNGLFGLPPDGRRVVFTGIAIWRVAGDRLAECWVERAAFEAYRTLTG